MATNKEIGEIVAMLSAAYPRFKPTPETLKTYTLMLKDIPGDALQAAALKCAASGTFFPSVHELRQAVSEIRRKAGGVPSAYEAWEEVSTKPMAEVHRRLTGEYDEVNRVYFIEEIKTTWAHPLVEKVARQLGWPRSFPGENPGVDRAHFFKAYEHALSDAVSDDIELPQVRAYIEGQARQIKDLLPRGDSNGS